MPTSLPSSSTRMRSAFITVPTRWATSRTPRETAGLPHDFIRARYADSLRIPMIEGARCLNLSNAVAIVAYEALRQLGFPNMTFEGRLEEI